MSKTYRDWSPDQSYLFPHSPHDWLPEVNLVHIHLGNVATPDFSPIFAPYERERLGQPPFHPRIMIAIFLCCYATVGGCRVGKTVGRTPEGLGLEGESGEGHPPLRSSGR
jgi:hypothetical protein